MGTTHTIDEQGIAEVVMDNPPVNALTVAGWFDLADRLRALGRDPQRPRGFEGIEDLGQRFTLMPADVPELKRFIATHCASSQA